MTFGPATTVLDDNSNITIPQQGHQSDSNNPFVTSNNPDAVASTFRPSLPITQVWDFITLNLILNLYLFRALLLTNTIL